MVFKAASVRVWLHGVVEFRGLGGGSGSVAGSIEALPGQVTRGFGVRMKGPLKGTM